MAPVNGCEMRTERVMERANMINDAKKPIRPILGDVVDAARVLLSLFKSFTSPSMVVLRERESE